MKTKRKSAKVAVSLLALAGLLVFSLFAVGGSLEPSAPPGPTMKTLDEVEPRVPIHASDLPLTITQPNSYYLVEDVNFEPNDVHAITIECNDVTVDLMGYTLKGPDSGTKSGIYMDGRSNVEIRNGTVRVFYTGIVAYGNCRQCRVINVRATSNSSTGISFGGRGHLIKDCTAAQNGGDGIFAGGGCTVTGNTAYSNQSRGIYAMSGCTISGNTAYNNQSVGIETFLGCTVTGNTTYNNQSTGINVQDGCTVTGNTSYFNQMVGIFAGSGSTVADNTAYQNNQASTTWHAGIYVFDGCLVKGNTLRANNQNNIYVYGSGSAVEENLVTNCTTGNGIYFNAGGNFYANNRASTNVYDYNDPGGNTNGGGNVSF